MLSIFAVLSDIPFVFAELFSKITGADTSAFLDFISNSYSEITDALRFIMK